jgi:hypothetical protein
MVWVVKGTLQNDPKGAYSPSPSTPRADPLLLPLDPADTMPPASEHYLRPGRTYKVGRMGGVRAEAKGGKQGAASRQRPYDFRLSSLAISKEGLAQFVTSEEWDPVRVSLLPYSCCTSIDPSRP